MGIRIYGGKHDGQIVNMNVPEIRMMNERAPFTRWVGDGTIRCDDKYAFSRYKLVNMRNGSEIFPAYVPIDEEPTP